MQAIIRGISPSQAKVVRFIDVLQLPTYPIPPPAGSEALGLITWDLPEIVRYTVDTELTGNVEVSNPSAEEKLYVVSYYFLDPNGVVAGEGFIEFVTDDLRFTAFYLPPQAPAAFFSVSFSSNELDYAFGLRMLLCEMEDSTAKVIQETSRVQILMASESTYNKYQAPSVMTNAVMAALMVSMLGIVIAKV